MRPDQLATIDASGAYWATHNGVVAQFPPDLSKALSGVDYGPDYAAYGSSYSGETRLSGAHVIGQCFESICCRISLQDTSIMDNSGDIHAHLFLGQPERKFQWQNMTFPIGCRYGAKIILGCDAKNDPLEQMNVVEMRTNEDMLGDFSVEFSGRSHPFLVVRQPVILPTGRYNHTVMATMVYEATDEGFSLVRVLSAMKGNRVEITNYADVLEESRSFSFSIENVTQGLCRRLYGDFRGGREKRDSICDTVEIARTLTTPDLIRRLAFPPVLPLLRPDAEVLNTGMPLEEFTIGLQAPGFRIAPVDFE